MSIKMICFALLIPLGAFLFVYGGYDDSPGAQGLGLLVVITGAVGATKSRAKNSTPRV